MIRVSKPKRVPQLIDILKIAGPILNQNVPQKTRDREVSDIFHIEDLALRISQEIERSLAKSYLGIHRLS